MSAVCFTHTLLSVSEARPCMQARQFLPSFTYERSKPSARISQVAKAPRLDEDKLNTPKSASKVKLESIEEPAHVETAIISDNESQSSTKLRPGNNGVKEDSTLSKNEKAHLLRGIDDAITSVIEFARRSIAEDSPEDRARKKLQVDDFYDYLSDSDARSDADAKSTGEESLCVAGD